MFSLQAPQYYVGWDGVSVCFESGYCIMFTWLMVPNLTCQWQSLCAKVDEIVTVSRCLKWL